MGLEEDADKMLTWAWRYVLGVEGEGFEGVVICMIKKLVDILWEMGIETLVPDDDGKMRIWQ